MARLAVLLTILLTLHQAAPAQEPAGAPGKASPVRNEPSADAAEALANLRQLTDEALTVEPLDERVRLLAALADSWWDWDEAVARRLLQKGFDLALDARQAAGQGPVESDPDSLLVPVNSVAARRDPALSKRLMEKWQAAVAAAAGEKAAAKSDPKQLSAMILSNAARAVGGDDKRGRALFRQSVAQYVLRDHTYFLIELRKKSPQLADALFADILETLTLRPVNEANEVLTLSSYLFSPDGGISYSVVGGYNAANLTANSSAAPKNPALARQYLTFVLRNFEPGPAVPHAVVHFALKSLMPQYQALMPQQAAEAHARMAGLQSYVSRGDAAAFERSSKAYGMSAAEQAESWEERLRKADRVTDAALRDLEYYTIVDAYLLPRKEFARAVEVAGRISNPELKETLEDYSTLLLVQESLKARDASNFEALLKTIRTPLLRAVALSEAGAFHVRQKGAAQASEFLARAAAESARVADGQDRTQLKLLAAQLLLPADAQKGFEAAADAFREVNRFPAFNIRRTEFVVRASVYGMSNDLHVNPPARANLLTAVDKMCDVNCAEAFTASRLIEDKAKRAWAGLRAVNRSLAQAPRPAKRPGG